MAVGPAAEIDLDHHFWLHPDWSSCTPFFGRDCFERRLADLERFELPKKRTRHLTGEAGACAPGIFELTVVVESKHQRPDGARVGCRWHDTGYDEFLPVRAFRLEPVMATNGLVWAFGKFRYDAFQAHLAGMPQQGRSGLAQRFAQPQNSARRLPFEQCRQ